MEKFNITVHYTDGTTEHFINVVQSEINIDWLVQIKENETIVHTINMNNVKRLKAELVK